MLASPCKSFRCSHRLSKRKALLKLWYWLGELSLTGGSSHWPKAPSHSSVKAPPMSATRALMWRRRRKCLVENFCRDVIALARFSTSSETSGRIVEYIWIRSISFYCTFLQCWQECCCAVWASTQLSVCSVTGLEIAWKQNQISWFNKGCLHTTRRCKLMLKILLVFTVGKLLFLRCWFTFTFFSAAWYLSNVPSSQVFLSNVTCTRLTRSRKQLSASQPWLGVENLQKMQKTHVLSFQ